MAKLYTILLMVAWFFSIPCASAATIDVDTLEVNVVNDGKCSLAEAILASNSNQSVDSCESGSGNDQINLSEQTYILETVHDTRFGDNGLPCIEEALIIEGREATITRNLNAPNFRIFCVLDDAALTIKDITISNGVADGPTLTHSRGGGLLSRGTLQLDNVSFRSNTARVQGGAAFINGGSASVANSIFIENHAGKGGAIRTDASSIVSIENSMFSKNSAEFGGGIFANNSTITISEGSFSENNSDVQGGGITISGSEATIQDSVFSKNITGDKGGAIRIDNNSQVRINNSSIEDNISTDYGGGGIYLILSTLTLENSTLARNSSGRGGALLIDVAHADITNTTFSANTARIYGAALYLDADEALEFGNASMNVVNTTIANNIAQIGAGGIWMNPISKAKLRNTLIAYNTFRNCSGPGVIDADQSNWVDDEFCSTIASADPLLEELKDNGGTTKTHALAPESPVIGLANPNLCPATDQRGSPRGVGSDCDVGAFELQVAPPQNNNTISNGVPSLLYLLLLEESDESSKEP